MIPSDYYFAETISATRARIVGYAKAAGLILTNFIKGSVPEQIMEAVTSTANHAAAQSSQVVRGVDNLDSATDPGDYDPYDASNQAAAPGPGALSAMGAGRYGTPRLDNTFATGFFTIDNTANGSPLYVSPEQVTFTRSTVHAVTGAPVTYRNSGDATVYTNPDGTATVPALGTLDVPVSSEEKGTYCNAGAGTLSLTTVLGPGVTGTNALAILASDREAADPYRARCKTAPAILSPNGADDAYRWIAISAKKNSDTLSLFFFPPWGDGTTGIGIDDATNKNRVSIPGATGDSLGISDVYVDSDNTTGNVGVYYRTAAGVPAGGVVTDIAALSNAYVRPQCNTVTHYAAVGVTITIAATVKAKAGSGVTAAVVAAAVNTALDAAFASWAIGGYDQTAGAGTIYRDEIMAVINGAHPAIYHVTLTTPAGDTALAKGRVAVRGGTFVAGDVTIV